MIRRIVILSLCLNAVMLSFAEIKHLNKQEFLEKVYNYEKYPSEWKFQAKRPCLIDFYATWCGPCKMMHPVLEQLKSEMGDKVKILKVDVDKNLDLAKSFGIQSVPTLMIFKNGNNLWRQSGAMSAKDLKAKIEIFL